MSVHFQDTITHALENVCRILPHDIAPQCKDFLEQYGPAVLQMLADKIDPVVICKALHLCEKSSTSQSKSTANIQSGNLYIFVCLFVCLLNHINVPVQHV